MVKLQSTAISSKPAGDEEEDDYMFMTIQEPTQPPQKETYTQRRIRKQREVRTVPLHRPIHLISNHPMYIGRTEIPLCCPVCCAIGSHSPIKYLERVQNAL